MSFPKDKTLFLLDAHALIYRAYYAFLRAPRINSKGLDTSAIFGFTNSLLDLIKNQNPTHMGVVFDAKGENFRHLAYPKYKSHRQEMPESIQIAIPYIQKILNAFHIPVLLASGYEADDLIGTLAVKAKDLGYLTYMVTPDKDFVQLVSDTIKIYRPSSRGNQVEILGVEEVNEKYGFENPAQMIDFLAMMGDASDHIPGLPGVGEKTAAKFIKEYKSLENLLTHVDQLSGKLREKIKEGKDLGILSKKLAKICTSVPIEFEEEGLRVKNPDLEKVKILFEELEFSRTLENIYKLYKKESKQVTLFDFPSEKLEVEKMEINDDPSVYLSESPLGAKNIKNTPHFYQIVSSEVGRKLLLKKLIAEKEVSLDSETDSLDALKANLVGLSFSWEPHKGYYLVFPENFESTKKILEEFIPFFENENILKIGHNLKYDLKVLYKYEIFPKGPFYDTMIAHYLLQSESRHNLNALAENYLSYKPISIESLIGEKGKNQKSMREVPLEIQAEYAIEDADITLQLKEKFDLILKENGLEKLFYEVEMPLMPVLLKMEIIGICLNTKELEVLSKEIGKDLDLLESKIYHLAKQKFNIASPKQLGEILFEKLKIVEKPRKTKTGQYATSEQVLQELSLKHEIIKEILEYRGLEKLKNTYINALPREINEKTNRIHTIFGQTTTSTGRLSSISPNLQNIPIKSLRGQQVRAAFFAKDENHLILSADYSQIELRLMAHLSKDIAMKEAFLKEEDIHASTASHVFGVPIDKVTKKQRSHAKTINFGIIYGVSAFGLSQQTGLSNSESKALIDSYYATYPSLKEYISWQIAFAKKNGFVETILGRRRYLPDIDSKNAVVRTHSERNAINAPVQGSAADMIKIAMVKMDAIFMEKNLQSKMLLQVHDELVFEIKKEELEEVKILIKRNMEEVLKLEVPLKVDLGWGKNWLEAH